MKNFWLYFSLVLGIQWTISAQQIILDLPTRAGELTLFPEVGNENNYYYLADKAALAIGSDGKPQFSFLRYVENQRSGSDEENIREGEGGGIVHAVVSLHVTDDQLKDAERALRRINSDGTIVGPIVYKSGTFGLVSSFKEENGEFTKKVVGLGAAPILDGQKAAISIRLTKLGAKILWESFKTATPDISITFEMDIQGFRLPKRAKIEANFEQIYDHKAFNAGISTPYLAAEIKIAFDELMKSGAIKVEQVGSDEGMNALISTAYNKLAEMMFAPIGGSGTPDLSQLTQGRSNNQSVLDRATRMMNNNRSRNQGSGDITKPIDNQYWTFDFSPNQRFLSPSKAAYMEYSAYMDTDHQLRLDTVPDEEVIHMPPDTIRLTRPPPPETTRPDTTPSPSSTPPQSPTTPATTPATSPATTPDSTATPRDSTRNNNGANGANEESDNNSGGVDFAIVATFEMKRVKQSGKFVIDLNKWTQDLITTRFDENIGNLSRYMDDPQHFHQINTDDPLYQQREIVVMVDGSNASDFGEFINFASVRMKKTHTEGAITNDEVRIDRFNFNKNGNYFKMLYGWNGDDPEKREKWMEYDYEILWSFFGNYEVQEDLKTTSFGAVNIKPPLKKLNIELQGDLATLTDAGVRSVTIKIMYKIGDKVHVKQETIAVGPEMAFKDIEIITPLTEYSFDYEISWRIRGGETIQSNLLTTNQSILFIDELP